MVGRERGKRERKKRSGGTKQNDRYGQSEGTESGQNERVKQERTTKQERKIS